VDYQSDYIGEDVNGDDIGTQRFHTMLRVGYSMVGITYLWYREYTHR
jgi:hypothetical protein